MTLYEALVDLAQHGYHKINIDLTSKTIKVGKQAVVKDCELKQHKIKVGDEVYEFDDLINEKLDMNDLYKQYKHSVPSERGMRGHFKALSANELSDAQLAFNMSRLEAQVRLEAYVALAAITGLEVWPNEKHWY